MFMRTHAGHVIQRLGHRAARLGVCALLVACVSPPGVRAQANGSSGTAGASRAVDAAAMLAPARLRTLPDSSRREWEAYVARSTQAQAVDRALLEREMQAAGTKAMTRAPHVAASFTYETPRTDAWFSTDSARRMVASILSYQTPSGGWSKHVDFAGGPRAAGQSFFSESDKWQYIATIDNDATTAEVRFLMHAERVQRDSVVQRAIARGVEYLLNAQFPTGCWPQVWPLQGGYHDAATFNDGAVVTVLELLDQAARSNATEVPDVQRVRAAGAVTRGVQCMLNAQVRVGGVLTIWGQQHDPITLAPTSARSYELTSLTSKESAGIFDFLLVHVSRDTRIPGALAAAAAWFDRTAIAGMRYDGRNGLVPDASAGLLWARLYEIGTDQPMFSNRDGIKRYSFGELTDRRAGYGWYSDQPVSALRRYRQWLTTRTTPKPAREWDR